MAEMTFGQAYHDYKRNRADADDAFSMGDYQQAADSYNEALRIVESFEKKLPVMFSMMGNFFHHHHEEADGRDGDHEGPMRHGGLMGMGKLIPYANLPECYLHLGKYQEAYDIADKEDKMIDPFHDRDPYPISFRTMVSKAEALYWLGKVDEANAEYAKAETEWLVNSKKDHGHFTFPVPEQVSAELDRIAEHHLRRGELEPARVWYGHAMHAWTAAKNQVNAAIAQNRIGRIELMQSEAADIAGDSTTAAQKAKSAEEDLGLALDAHTEKKGEKNPNTAKMLFDLSDAQWHNQKWFLSAKTRGEARIAWMLSKMSPPPPPKKFVKNKDDSRDGFMF